MVCTACTASSRDRSLPQPFITALAPAGPDPRLGDAAPAAAGAAVVVGAVPDRRGPADFTRGRERAASAEAVPPCDLLAVTSSRLWLEPRFTASPPCAAATKNLVGWAAPCVPGLACDNDADANAARMASSASLSLDSAKLWDDRWRPRRFHRRSLRLRWLSTLATPGDSTEEPGLPSPPCKLAVAAGAVPARGRVTTGVDACRCRVDWDEALWSAAPGVSDDDDGRSKRLAPGIRNQPSSRGAGTGADSITGGGDAAPALAYDAALSTSDRVEK